MMDLVNAVRDGPDQTAHLTQTIQPRHGFQYAIVITHCGFAAHNLHLMIRHKGQSAQFQDSPGNAVPSPPTHIPLLKNVKISVKVRAASTWDFHVPV